MLRQLLKTLIFYLIIKLLLLGVGSAVGWLLHALAPSIDLGVGILIGVIVTGLSVHFYARLMGLTSTLDAFDTFDISDLPPPPITIVSPPEPPAPRRRRRR